MSALVVELHELDSDNPFEHEELYSSEDEDYQEAILGSKNYFDEHRDTLTDILSECLSMTEEMVQQEQKSMLVVDEYLYMKVAAWTKTISDEIGHLAIGFNGLITHSRRKLELERHRLRALDRLNVERINNLMNQSNRFQRIAMQQETELKAIKESFIEEKRALLAKVHRLERRNSVLMKKVDNYNEDTSIKQRPRRCPNPSVEMLD